MSIFSKFSEWNHRRKVTKYLVNELPKVVLVNYQTMQELDPDISKKELYEIIIGSVAETFGIRHEDINNYTKRILQMAEKVSKLDAIPLCLCTVVLSLILTISGNTSNIFIIVAKNIVWETIPEDL